MTIDSVTENQNNGVFNTNACDNYILGGQEPVNWAYVTKSGVSQAPADPLFTGTFDNPNFSAVNPDYNRDLLMSPGDRIRVHMHDTPAGYRVDMTDLKTHKSGSMTASIANGFAHVLYTPGSGPCKSAPYAFHAEYDTANPRGNTWSAHTTNVSYSDEIGHFEHCLQLDANFNCAVAGSDDPTLDDDDVGCVPGKDAFVVHINGCFGADDDFDGPSYQKDWPGTNPDPKVDQKLHPQPVLFTSPTDGRAQLSGDQLRGRPARDRELLQHGPRVRAASTRRRARSSTPSTRPGPTAPPAAGRRAARSSRDGERLRRELRRVRIAAWTAYPVAGFTTVQRFENFNSGNLANACPVG